MEDADDSNSNNSNCKRCLTSVFCGRAGLLVVMTFYALIGAVLFKNLEGGNDGDFTTHVQKSREDCLRELWLITERLNVLYEKNWTKLVTEQLKRFERAVVESSGGGDDISNSAVNSKWTYGGALLYSLTLLTTVGYGRLSPKTALAKILTMIYAVIGVPLMLILLSALGALFATGFRKVYQKLCCKTNVSKSKTKFHSVGYHKAPTSPSNKHLCRSFHDDSATVQIHTNSNCKSSLEAPKRAVLATVRASRARGRCRQGQVRQTLTEPQLMCHSHLHGTPSRSVTSFNSDPDETEEEDNEHGSCVHDTPSRMPLIWRPPDSSSSSPLQPEVTPSVPVILVVFIFAAYVFVGAVALCTLTGDWNFLDAAYFCFVALSTIGVEDKLPQSGDWHSQLQILACCLYLFVGLVVVAMCFSLVHEEVASRCRQFATNMGLLKS